MRNIIAISETSKKTAETLHLQTTHICSNLQAKTNHKSKVWWTGFWAKPIEFTKAID